MTTPASSCPPYSCCATTAVPESLCSRASKLSTAYRRGPGFQARRSRQEKRGSRKKSDSRGEVFQSCPGLFSAGDPGHTPTRSTRRVKPTDTLSPQGRGSNIGPLSSIFNHMFFTSTSVFPSLSTRKTKASPTRRLEFSVSSQLAFPPAPGPCLPHPHFQLHAQQHGSAPSDVQAKVIMTFC